MPVRLEFRVNTNPPNPGAEAVNSETWGVPGVAVGDGVGEGDGVAVGLAVGVGVGVVVAAPHPTASKRSNVMPMIRGNNFGCLMCCFSF
jgi:hypothetical protein